MSENTLNAALRRLGYSKTQMTAHGFKGMASTRLNGVHHLLELTGIEKELGGWASLMAARS
jgi:hypothetical protein